MAISQSRKLLLPLLVWAIASLLIFTMWALWTGNQAAAGLSAVASCLSALGALLISLRSQWSDEARREREKSASDQLRDKQRRAIAALYSAEISAWRLRRDLGNFLEDIAKATPQETLPQRSALDVLLLARDRLQKFSGVKSPPEDLCQGIELESKAAASSLALPAFSSFPAIPSIWTTQFKREDIDLLGESAPTFFLTMSLVWTNLTLLVQQIPSEAGLVAFVRDQQTIYVRKYLEQLTAHITDVVGLFHDFLTLADECAALLLNRDRDDPLAALKVPAPLFVRSREASPQLATLQREIELDKTLDRAHFGRDVLSNVSKQSASALEAAKRLEEFLKEARKAEQATVDEIEERERNQT